MANTMLETGQVKSAAYNGATQLDISGITGDCTLFFRLESLTAGKNCYFQFQDSVNAFTANQPVASFAFSGAADVRSDITVSMRLYQNKGLRAGTASAVLRIVLASIDAGGTAQYSAWISY